MNKAEVSGRPPLALIAGPTASGKSALALALAERTGGVIVNADASQVYADLRILSARPDATDEARAEHRLFGTIDAAEACSAARWAADARAVVAEVHARGRLPILVGGTGLYIRTLLDGIAPVPAIDPVVRARIRALDRDELAHELAVADPDAASRLAPADSARRMRALEVALSTGRTLASWQADRVGGIGDAVSLAPLLLLPPRDWLTARIEARFAAMVADGAAAEVERLLARGLDPDLPAMRAIGVREIAAATSGTSSLAGAIAAATLATRRYAKRQATWFTHQPPLDWSRLTTPLSTDEAHGCAIELLETGLTRTFLSL